MIIFNAFLVNEYIEGGKHHVIDLSDLRTLGKHGFLDLRADKEANKLSLSDNTSGLLVKSQ